MILVTGPSSGGKSLWAEKYADSLQKPVVYIATGLINERDKEWTNRLNKHKIRRPGEWVVYESSDELIATINSINRKNTLIIDSLGGFVSVNLKKKIDDWNNICDDLISVLVLFSGTLVIVTEEVGWSLTPLSSTGRQFVERLGLLNQKIQHISNKVILVIQGMAIDLSAIQVKDI
tara:strand:+ start:87 stop:614 length:528 start_codon:yes stop_codon:yes gene_type:complete